LATPAMWQAMSQAGQRRAQAFTWPCIVERTQQLYQQLLRQDTATRGQPTVAEAAPSVRSVPYAEVSCSV